MEETEEMEKGRERETEDGYEHFIQSMKRESRMSSSEE